MISPDEDAVTIVDDAPEGTLFCFEPGTHRLRSRLIPKRGDAFVGASGAVLNGSTPVSPTKSGEYWVITGQTQEWEPRGRCMDPAYEGCRFPEDVYFDHRPLWQVTDRESLVPGSFFFDYPQDRIYLADDPEGHLIEVTASLQAISADYMKRAADDVVVSGLIIEKFANAYQTGAVHSGENWLIENNEVRLNHGIGICSDSRSWVRDNYVHHNGEMGLCGRGASVRVTGNEISYNNTQGFDWWENGGSKWFYTTDLLVEDNYSHHNIGPGLWTDIDNVNATYRDNVIRDNVGPGILHEISYSATITGNTITGNGFGYKAWVPAGILVVSSRNVVIESNLLRGNHGGVGLIQDDRVEGTLGPRSLKNITISENTIRYSRGGNGYWSFRPEGSARWRPRGLRFSNNTYDAPSKAGFRWVERSMRPRGWTGLGFDLDSVFR